MINQVRHIINAILLLVLILFVVFVFGKIFTEKTIEKNNSPVTDYTNNPASNASSLGKSLFNVNCASCHSITKDMVGPALSGLEERGPWKNRKTIYEWINNPSAFIAKDNYAKTLKGKFGVVMTAFPDLREKDIDAIVDYINNFQKVAPMSVAIR